MFGLSGEHLLILAGVLLIFGPRKLPELGSSIGKALRNFKEGLNNTSSQGTIEARNATASESVHANATNSAQANNANQNNHNQPSANA